MGNGPFEDVFPTQNGDFLASHVSLPEGIFFEKKQVGTTTGDEDDLFAPLKKIKQLISIYLQLDPVTPGRFFGQVWKINISFFGNTDSFFIVP